MELIFELIYEIFIEGFSALVGNKKLPRPLRILFLTLLLGPFFALFYVIYREPGLSRAGTFGSALLMALLAIGWLLGTIWILRTRLKKENP